MAIGLDFGTTNSSIAIADPNVAVRLGRFSYSGGLTESFRSLLYLERLREFGRTTIKSWSGPVGIDHYLQSDDKGRLVQSLKSFLSSRNLQTTEVFGIAGDSFDARIIRHLVSPALGAGTSLRSGDKLLPVPNWVYFKLERWHHLSFLKSAETINMLQSVVGQALEPDKIRALVYLVKHDLGYHLHRAVQRVKLTLSHAESTVFRFSDGVAELEERVTRGEFEAWIQDEIEAMSKQVDTLLSKSGVDRKDVDMVFLTGGSSFVPAVGRIFELGCGPSRIRTGDEFTSVARGLALKALELA